jgi:putative ABC transport system ATP-binding protein
MELLKMVGLEDQADKLPAAVSTGQQQSAAIARGLATDPPIIVADEPTGNLDSRSADVIIHLFDQLARQGKTIAMVTHDPSLTERTNRTLIICDGEIVEETVASALPLLTHRQMLKITHQLVKKTYQPGETILEKGHPVDHFFMIAKGQVEVIMQSPKCPYLVLAHLGAGEFFGEVELVYGGDSIASIRVAPGAPVELVTLPRDAFQELLCASPLTEQAISKLVYTRLEGNRSQAMRCS